MNVLIFRIEINKYKEILVFVAIFYSLPFIYIFAFFLANIFHSYVWYVVSLVSVHVRVLLIVHVRVCVNVLPIVHVSVFVHVVVSAYNIFLVSV